MKDSDFSSVLAERRAVVRAELDRIFRSPLAANPAGSTVAANPGGSGGQPTANSPAEFIWEVGCGHGHFLTAYASAYRDRVCLGVDIASDRIARAKKKAERARLPHLHFLRAEASLFLAALPPEVRICTAFVLFPDPWPKSRHHKHRVLQPDFLLALAERAATGCRLHFRTDFEPYYQEARATAAASPKWSLVDAPWPFEFETVFQSRAAAGFHSFIAELRGAPPAT